MLLQAIAQIWLVRPISGRCFRICQAPEGQLEVYPNHLQAGVRLLRITHLGTILPSHLGAILYGPKMRKAMYGVDV